MQTHCWECHTLVVSKTSLHIPWLAMLPSMMFAAKHMLLYTPVNKSAWTFAQGDEEAAAPVSHRRKEVDVEEDDEDDDHEYMTNEGGFVCETVVADGLPKGAGIPTEVCLHNSLIKPQQFAVTLLHTVTPAVSLLSQATLHLCND